MTGRAGARSTIPLLTARGEQYDRRSDNARDVKFQPRTTGARRPDCSGALCDAVMTDPFERVGQIARRLPPFVGILAPGTS